MKSKKSSKTQRSKYELLAPAGDFSMLSAAVNAGADAVYLGLKEFNMRANAGNFKISDLREIKKICEKGRNGKVKIYLTLNTIMYNNELKKLEEIIKKTKKYVDAVICEDFAVVELCKKYKIPFHISTQASVSNLKSALFYKKLGAERIILARELNLKQVREIAKRGIEVEAFTHGAMCVSVSGRCFTSQFLFNKSANRGECMHPCRRSYKVYNVIDNEENELKVENNKIFSAKDLCTLPFIERMKKAGIKAFKIEGRNRDARYADTVVRVYRKALDKKLTKKELEQGLNELKSIYNKGFSSGFYLGLPSVDDFSKTEHSSADRKKHFIGKITHVFPNINVIAVKVVSPFKVGEEISIIGKTTGIVNTSVESMEIHNKQIKKAEKGKEVGIKIKISPNVIIRKNDEVYVIRKR